jgi:hypothetical protein
MKLPLWPVPQLLAVDLPVVGPLTRVLTNIEDMAGGVARIHEEFVGMRRDIVTLDEHVQELRGEVSAMTGSVRGIRTATEKLDERVDRVSDSLDSLDAVVGRFGRFGRRRGEKAARATEAAPADS